MCNRKGKGGARIMKLTKKNYFSKKANMEYMSCSQIKAFRKCEASALAELEGKYIREQTTALLVGGFIDAYFEGEKAYAKFINEHGDALFTKKGDFIAEIKQAFNIIERIENDELSMKYLNGKKQVIMTGAICNVPVKIKIDVLHDDKIVDQKIMKDFENIYVEDRGHIPWFDAWGYDLQGAIYQEIVRQNVEKQLPFYLQAATKEKTPDIDIVHISQSYLDFEMDKLINEIERYDAIKKKIIEPDRCEHCDYCKSTKSL